MISILHLADLHLDRTFLALEARSGIGGVRRHELRRALTRILEQARSQHSAAVTAPFENILIGSNPAVQ